MPMTITFTFSPGAVIFASRFNQNFSDVKNWADVHEVATSGVHGVSAGAVVGTALIQSLTNKSLQGWKEIEESSDPASPISGQHWRRDYGLSLLKGLASTPEIFAESASFFEQKDDFDGVNLPDTWNGHPSGSGSIALLSGTAGGWARLSTGATSGSSYQYDQYNGAVYGFANSSNLPIICDFRLKLSSITNVVVRLALATDATANGNNTIYVEFDPATNANWRLITKNGATSQTTNTDIAVAASTTYHLRVLFTSGKIEFFIDGVLKATHSTQVPAAATIFHRCLYITNSAAADKQLDVDLVHPIARRI